MIYVHVGLKKFRDKRLTKDKWDILRAYSATKEAKGPYLFHMFFSLETYTFLLFV